MFTAVYFIDNLDNGKFYVGHTEDPVKRERAHLEPKVQILNLSTIDLLNVQRLEKASEDKTLDEYRRAQVGSKWEWSTWRWIVI